MLRTMSSATNALTSKVIGTPFGLRVVCAMRTGKLEAGCAVPRRPVQPDHHVCTNPTNEVTR
jgi:hypothetical protein